MFLICLIQPKDLMISELCFTPDATVVLNPTLESFHVVCRILFFFFLQFVF